MCIGVHVCVGVGVDLEIAVLRVLVVNMACVVCVCVVSSVLVVVVVLVLLGAFVCWMLVAPSSSVLVVPRVHRTTIRAGFEASIARDVVGYDWGDGRHDGPSRSEGLESVTSP